MSTRGLYGFRKDGIDKLTYNHCDSDPMWLGREIAAFCATTTLSDMKKVYDSIVLIDQDVPPTPEQIQVCMDYGYYDENVNSGSPQDWYCLLRNLQGDLEEYLKNAIEGRQTFMADYQEFIKDSLECRYAYIINLDTEKLEFYVGRQTRPQAGNRYGEEPVGFGFYPCRLCLELPLDMECMPVEAAEMMKEAEEKDENETDS